MVPRLFEEGKCIYNIDDISEELFVVRSGSVTEEIKVSKIEQTNASNPSNTDFFQFQGYGPGQWFGQSEVFLGVNRWSRVTSKEKTLLLCIRRSEL